MKSISVVLAGYISTTVTAKVVLERFTGPTAAYEAHRCQELMQAADNPKVARLKKSLDKFYGMKLVYLVKKEDTI